MTTKAPARPTELKVKVISAKNLIAADSNGKSDPFAIVYTKSGSSGTDKSIKTKKILETLNPTWNETFNLILRDRKDSLVIEIWDDDLFGKDHLGTAELSLEGLEHDKETPFVVKLNKQGEVSVAVTIKYNDKELDELHQKQEEEKKRLAAEAQRKKDEEDRKLAEAKKKEEDERKRKEEEDRKKKEEEDRKKKEEEQKKAQAAAQAPAKATTAPVQPSPAQTPAKATSAPATPASTTPAKPATTTTTQSSKSTSTSSTSTTASKPATKQVEADGPNYILIGGVVAALAVVGFVAFKYFQKN